MPMLVKIHSYCSANGSAASNFSGPGPVPIARSVLTPASRARCSMASRSSANCGKSMWACESIKSMVSGSELLTLARALYIVPLLQASADFYVFEKARQDGAAFWADGGGDDHAVRFDAAKFARS